MKFISYSQNFEDIMLWRALKHIKNGFYIDVGAAWPDEHSVTNAFYKNGWRGINIEPNRQFINRYFEERPRDINLGIALGENTGNAKMCFINDTGLSSLDEKITEGHRSFGWEATPSNVQVKTLANICNEYCLDFEIHFLKIDVEGFEEQVLKGNDWLRFRPWIVVVEATLPMSQVECYEDWESILLGANYNLAYADGLNRFYISKEHEELLPAFKYPPNVFDDFKLIGEIQAEAKAHQAEAKAHQAEAKAHQAEHELQEITTSRSWRLTKPLRDYNQKVQIRSLILRTKQQILRRLRLVKVIKPLIYSQPWLLKRLQKWGIVNKTAFESKDDDFSIIHSGLLAIHFANEPLLDHRGIGRVSREIFAQLKSHTINSVPINPVISTPSVNKLYFYSSIHWCPNTLPQPSVVMIHDVIPLLFPEEFPRSIRHEWKHRYSAIARQATQIVTISESSADDISLLLEIPRDRITVCFNGVTTLPVAKRPSILLPDKSYLVFLGSHDHHKNVNVVLQALSLPEASDIELLMIGDNNGCLALVKKLGLDKRVHFLGRLNDEDVGYAITHSLALVFPSLYEGFGLPPMEAALLGTPSICSNRPAMTELLESAALFASPTSPQEWASAIANLHSSTELRDSIRFEALKRAQNYTWAASVDKLRDIFINSALE